MPQHITVYCRKPITVGNWLERWSGDPDYLTAAETAGFDEDLMRDALRELRVAGGDITYAGATRPIQATHYTEAALVRTMVEEACEDLSADASGIAELLASAREVVDFELGFQQAEGVGGVIAEQIAFAVAIETDGVVDFYGNEWQVLEGRQLR